jgi:uncharacterized protein YgbK (DUF1537 family)
VFQNKLIPVLGGMPALGRYCLFGNLFARMGIGSNGNIYRLDRHPSMSKHPVTPSDESDLRLHLAKQTDKKIGLINVLQLEKPIQHWNEVLQAGEELVLVDAVYDWQMGKIGEWMNSLEEDNALFSAGGSGVEAALGNYWNETGLLRPRVEWQPIQKTNALLVVSGSCSPVTAAQIEWAKVNGFEEVILDVVEICNGGLFDATQIINLLNSQKHVMVHTGTKQAKNLSSEKLGTALGIIAKEAVIHTGIKRVLVAGGDTSSFAARAMEIEAVEMVAPLTSGAPLCKAYSNNETMKGLEVNFKGGQFGSEDYFGMLINGKVT